MALPIHWLPAWVPKFSVERVSAKKFDVCPFFSNLFSSVSEEDSPFSTLA
jgi:hypothetical protein